MAATGLRAPVRPVEAPWGTLRMAAPSLPKPLRTWRRPPPPACPPPPSKLAGSLQTLPLSIPNLTPVPATTSPMAPRRTDLRRVHHFHTMPTPPRFLPWNDKSWTGDHYAISRYASALSLQFDHLARVIGVMPSHYFLGGAAGLLFWFGTRQSIHSIVLGCRNLKRLREERGMIEAAWSAVDEAPVYLENLAHRNRMQRWQTFYFMAMDASAGVGATLVGLGTLFRGPLLGGLAHGLLHLAIPIATAGFVPLVLPSAIAIVDRIARTARAAVRTHVMERHMDQLQGFDLKAAAQVEALYRQRQLELARFFMLDCAARVGLVVGATCSVFGGPYGLAMLIPSTVCVIVAECFSRRIVNVDDTLLLEERMRLRTDEDFFAAIAEQHLDLETLKALREERIDAYPTGWGTFWRPLCRLYRSLRGSYTPDSERSKDVLAAFAHRSPEAGPNLTTAWPQPTPRELMDLIDQGRVRLQFSAAILQDPRLRAAFQGRGFNRDGKKWTLDADVMAEAMEAVQDDPDADPDTVELVDRVYRKAEEVLLTTGLTESYRRARALLDHYGRYVQTAARLATTRSDS